LAHARQFQQWPTLIGSPDEPLPGIVRPQQRHGIKHIPMTSDFGAGPMNTGIAVDGGSQHIAENLLQLPGIRN
jgi:hypothetical protein